MSIIFSYSINVFSFLKLFLNSQYSNDIIPNECIGIIDSVRFIGLIDQETDITDNVIRRYPVFHKMESNSKEYFSLAVQAALSYHNI